MSAPTVTHPKAPALTRRQLVCVFCLTAVVVGGIGIARTPATWSDEWDQATALLISNSVYRKVHFGWDSPMAYPFDLQGEPAKDWRSDRDDQNYYRQFGLEVYALAAVAPRDVDALGDFLLAARYGAALVSALVIAALVTAIARWCGWLTALALVAFVAADARYGYFLHSLYWLPALSLLPLLVVATGYSPNSTRSRFRWVLATFAVVVFVKALCGYEHISTIALAPCAAIVFLAGMHGQGWQLRHALIFFVVAGAAVAATLAVHFLTLTNAFGSASEAAKHTIGNAVNRSYGAGSTRSQFAGAYGMLAQNKLLTALVALWIVALLVWSVLRGRQGHLRTTNDSASRLTALAVASLIGFLAACSWFVLMRAHVSDHPQYNALPFFHSFVWFAIPFVVDLGWAIVALFGSRAEGHSTAKES